MTTKEMFLNSPHREAHQKWVESAAADAARDAAFLMFAIEASAARSPDLDAHSQLVGARKVLDILFRLHLKDEPPKRTTLTNLKAPS